MTAPLLYYDNLGATYLSSNPVFHARIKHVEFDFHFVKDWVINKSLTVPFILGKDQLADVLPKPLSTTRFHHLRSNLRLKYLPLDLMGSVRVMHAHAAIQSLQSMMMKRTQLVNEAL